MKLIDLLRLDESRLEDAAEEIITEMKSLKKGITILSEDQYYDEKIVKKVRAKVLDSFLELYTVYIRFRELGLIDDETFADSVEDIRQQITRVI